LVAEFMLNEADTQPDDEDNRKIGKSMCTIVNLITVKINLRV